MKTSSGPESVRRCIKGVATFTILVGLVLLAVVWPAEAEIVYTPAHVKITENSSYNLDLNKDGVTDFIISTSQSQHTCPFGHIGLKDAVAETPVSGDGAESSPPAKLKLDDKIGPSETFYGGTGTMAWLEDCEFVTGGGNWIHDENCGYDCNHLKGLKGYLGLTFQIDGETHYGWALLSVSLTPKTTQVVVTLEGYAYETVADMPINAGQEK
jgi:hypothetical protein